MPMGPKILFPAGPGRWTAGRPAHRMARDSNKLLPARAAPDLSPESGIVEVQPPSDCLAGSGVLVALACKTLVVLPGTWLTRCRTGKTLPGPEPGPGRPVVVPPE